MSDSDFGRWWMWDGDDFMVRSLGDGRKVLPVSSRFPASVPEGAHLRVLPTENRRYADIEIIMPGGKRGAHLLLDRQRAEVLRDWLTAFIRRTTPSE